MPRGINVQENQTAISPTRQVKAGLAVAFGCAPIHTLEGATTGKVNVPLKFNSIKDFVLTLGSSDDYANFDLSELADLWFQKAANHPLIVVNVFDPDEHKTEVASEPQTFADDIITLDHAYVRAGELVKDSTETTTYVEDTDYTINRLTGVVTRLGTGSIGATDMVKVTYSYADPSKVVADDVIGEIDSGTGAASGFELIHEIFPRFGEVPGLVLAPRFGETPAVAIALAAKAKAINGALKALAVVDIPETQTIKTAVGTYKSTNSLTSEHMVVCWPRTKLGDVKYRLSAQFAASAAATCRAYGEVPYKSPSNEAIWATRTLVGSDEIWLGMNDISDLEEQGIVSALNWAQRGFRLGGSRTGAYPGSTDPKDVWIPVRWMFNWMENTIILTSFEYLDMPIVRSKIDLVLNSINGWINSLPEDSLYKGSRLDFLEADNNSSDVLAGKVNWRLYIAPPPPAIEFNYIVEYDTSLITPALFGQS